MGRVDGRRALLWLAAGLGAPAWAQAPTDEAGGLRVWIILELPELASLPRDRRAERTALRLKILAQQDEVMGRLRQLGAIEQARVQQVRNALAVRLPSAQMEAARKIPGVRAVSLVRDIDRGPLVQGD
jgi:hypothetical protein